ncbi:MAG: signal peptidase II [Candidatus Bipolaricaulota bacterium]|nr:signal peptidase II [Candidatus Bipolaricaulota bacterium]MCS7275009.1 signal peptidase II [Candidatus Bipolaricaulota bacterium]MDW8110526.1 signal peptidase II [Candidatus Bipolaricaulota bacterium]MDW8329323.1 signal peptidase II [Candidatus Bipolaricaulota bacterium]
MRVKMLLGVLSVWALDQFSKYLALTHLELGRSLAILPGIFHLTLTYNTGGAFGLFYEYGDLIAILAAGASLTILGVLLWNKPRQPTMTLGLIGIAGGALGNLTDRWLPERGAVVDFLDFRIWPVFNLADTAIVLGTGLVLLGLLQREGE